MLFLNEQFSEHFWNLGVDVLFGAEYAINPFQYVSTTVCQRFFICLHYFFFVFKFFLIWACVKWTWTYFLVARFSSTSVWWCPAFSLFVLFVLPVLHRPWPPTVSCRWTLSADVFSLSFGLLTIFLWRLLDCNSLVCYWFFCDVTSTSFLPPSTQYDCWFEVDTTYPYQTNDHYFSNCFLVYDLLWQNTNFLWLGHSLREKPSCEKSAGRFADWQQTWSLVFHSH